jgi:hypothetical protein
LGFCSEQGEALQQELQQLQPVITNARKANAQALILTFMLFFLLLFFIIDGFRCLELN